MPKIALIWASSNPDKFWNKILLDLVYKWYIVYPVNPKSKIINDIKVFKNISDIKENIDIFNFVTQPEVTLLTLKDNINFLRNKRIWCQPWSFNIEVEKYLLENNFTNYSTGSCIMLNKL